MKVTVIPQYLVGCNEQEFEAVLEALSPKTRREIREQLEQQPNKFLGRTNAPTKATKMEECKLCGGMFRPKAGMTNHLRKKHGIIKKETKKLPSPK